MSVGSKVVKIADTYCFYVTVQPKLDPGRLSVKVSRSHTDTHPTELLCSSDQQWPLPTKHTTDKRDEQFCPQWGMNQQSNGRIPTPKTSWPPWAFLKPITLYNSPQLITMIILNLKYDNEPFFQVFLERCGVLTAVCTGFMSCEVWHCVEWDIPNISKELSVFISMHQSVQNIT